MNKSPFSCIHASLMPSGPCPCEKDCYCKEHACNKTQLAIDIPPAKKGIWKLPKENKKIIHVNYDSIKKNYWIKKTFNIVLDPERRFTQQELTDFIEVNKDIRIVVRNK